MSSATADLRPSGDSRIELRHLRMREEREEWVVGRVDTGDFIAVPAVAVEVLRLLGEDLTIDQTRERIHAEQGRDIDVAGFVAGLVELGFVRCVDDEALPATNPPRATLPWLRAEHVRWTVSRPFGYALTIVLVIGVVALFRRPDLLPSYRDLLWTDHTSLVLLGNAAMAWTFVGLHELGHLVTARAEGVPGRMSLGTRLQFLAAQTDVSGIWASPRRRRMIVYLSGIVVNLVVAAIAVLVRTAVGPGTPTGRIAAAAVVLSLLFIPPQMLLFMRTDLYFVLQDLTNSRNLYADGSRYVRFRLRRGDRSENPINSLPAREQTAVRRYSAILVAGTAICLAVAITVSLPFALSIVSRSITGLFNGEGIAPRIDALVAVALFGGYWALWLRAWWRRHGGRVKSFSQSVTRKRRG